MTPDQFPSWVWKLWCEKAGVDEHTAWVDLPDAMRTAWAFTMQHVLVRLQVEEENA